MNTRLDRLFILLDTGSNPSTRKAAAQQLGEVQAAHPEKLNSLLYRLHKYICHNNWHTRIAASQALEAIILNTPLWTPSSNGHAVSNFTLEKSFINFENFNLKNIIENGSHLLAHEGTDMSDADSCQDANEKLASQRKQLDKQLGLKIGNNFMMDTSNIISNEDLIGNLKDSSSSDVKYSYKGDLGREILSDDKLSMSSSLKESLSSRQINQMKRKAKQFTRKVSREVSVNEEDEVKKAKLERLSSYDQNKAAENEVMVEWPFQNFCDILCLELFNKKWEARHGAATALREIISLQGEVGGMHADLSSVNNLAAHKAWMLDLALRLICILALDKFGDFISDQVVAPVRETTAQVLGRLAILMEENDVFKMVEILLQLLKESEWQCRHGGLLAIKYVLAAVTKLTSGLLTRVYTPLLDSLLDSVDDVEAAAAGAFLPVTHVLKETLSYNVTQLLDILWDSLLRLDDVTSSTNSIMTLLSSLLTNSADNLDCNKLKLYVPRIFPFLGHSSTLVRKSCLETFYALTSTNSAEKWLEKDIAECLLCLLFKNILTEHNEENLNLIIKVWYQVSEYTPQNTYVIICSSWIYKWINYLVLPSFSLVEENSLKSDNKFFNYCMKPESLKFYLGGPNSLHLKNEKRIACEFQARYYACRLLAKVFSSLSKNLPESYGSENSEMYVKIMLKYLNSTSAYQKLIISLIIIEWYKIEESLILPQNLLQSLFHCLENNSFYSEINFVLRKLQSDFGDFVLTLKHYKVNVNAVNYVEFNLDDMENFCNCQLPTILKNMKIAKKNLEIIADRRIGLLNSITGLRKELLSLDLMTLSALSGATVSFKILPQKLNIIIRPLMESIKKENLETLQAISCEQLTCLINLCIERENCPNAKVITNLCKYLSMDHNSTPILLEFSDDQKNGIISLNSLVSTTKEEKIDSVSNVGISFHSDISTSKKKKKMGSAGHNSSFEKMKEDEESQLKVQTRGATKALKNITTYFAQDLKEKCPHLWRLTFETIKTINESTNLDVDSLNNWIQSLRVLETIAPCLHKVYFEELNLTLLVLTDLLQHSCKAIRHMTARCIGVIATLLPTEVITVLMNKIIPELQCVGNVNMREGGIEMIYCILESLGLKIIPYIVLLIVPILGRMSDHNSSVRLLATQCFGTLIRLMPLDGETVVDENLPSDLLEKKVTELTFLKQLLNPKELSSFVISIPINATLRSYQQVGVDWLAFLNKYKLHGILCDDMGLGKTLQVICILGSDHHNKYLSSNRKNEMVSLVVCPTTLTGHWFYEIKKFVSASHLKPIQYVGIPQVRVALREELKYHNVIIASYDVVRNDIEFLSSMNWNYLILDEGHMIKNPKTKLSIAIKQLHANHRIILSGTPIQNGVMEVWSLFDFLIPGFLGTEKQFNNNYAKPILASRDAKSSSKEKESGVLAMESLHKQVLPFILRRTKDDVLSDLPPKITQEYYCKLSPIQEELYERFALSRAKKYLENSDGEPNKIVGPNTNIFQALQYLRKLCNHPKLVLSSQDPEMEFVKKRLETMNSTLDDIKHSAKLPVLKQLLFDCGIGVEVTSEEKFLAPVVSQHRVLIFCQLKAMLDIVENDLFKVHMPQVSYLRLDGSVPASSRFELVQKFNNDPSIDILLLTTSVGGLGLNLTGADTVIFIEHSWNPMVDLQAMDRAHRIGQKKVVNVYRLITKNTLEEKIISLQEFKIKTANTVISSENKSLQTMGTDQLLDLFTLEEKTEKKSEKPGLKSVIENLPALWDDAQYTDEYDLTTFKESLKK